MFHQEASVETIRLIKIQVEIPLTNILKIFRSTLRLSLYTFWKTLNSSLKVSINGRSFKTLLGVGILDS